jgi:hypothetical protein
MTRIVLIEATYGFGEIISEIRAIRGRFLPVDNAGCCKQLDTRAHPDA